jgi:hydrogenase nickel incorporation protein HypA/HybF
VIRSSAAEPCLLALKAASMHELSLCQNLVEILNNRLSNMGKAGDGRLAGTGAFACIEESALRFGFEITCRGTVAGCQLHLSQRPSQAWCWNCNESVEVSGDECARIATAPACSGKTTAACKSKVSKSIRSSYVYWCARPGGERR